MTRGQHSPAEDVMLAYWCDACDMGPGHWCKTAAGRRVANELHAARFWRAHDDGALPVREMPDDDEHSDAYAPDTVAEARGDK
jgi:hypothetical protein